VFVNNFLYF